MLSKYDSIVYNIGENHHKNIEKSKMKRSTSKASNGRKSKKDIVFKHHYCKNGHLVQDCELLTNKKQDVGNKKMFGQFG